MTVMTKPEQVAAKAEVTPPSLAPGDLARPKLMSVADAKAMDVSSMAEEFKAHINPGQMHFMKLLGFHKVKVESAEGMYYTDQNGRKILDFFGGFGSLALGHNHPRILAARKQFQDEKRHEIAIAFMSQYAAALAHNIAEISPGDLDMVFFGSSGSEAMEAAVKLAERAAGPERPKVVYAVNSFHGKTKGVLGITDGALYRGEFQLVDNGVRVPFGDIDAIEAAFKADPKIGSIVLETIQGGGGIIEAPEGFWTKLRALCDQYGVIWVADEVQCGYGRTGRFYAFEHYNVVPDITALAKSMGGGKTAMAAMIAKRDVYMKAYGTPKTAMIHAQATFGGIGEACITAIEALNVLYDEDLIDNAATTGDYLIAELKRLQAKYPKMIKEVRGKGFMVGLEFHDFSQTLPVVLRP
ncbi:MAG: aspartate aminotransferase family protein, partial [Notoacmeibacter sp.]|nr:aspartate aminotransferase family protein [Notoacmeibacter sp.]